MNRILPYTTLTINIADGCGLIVTKLVVCYCQEEQGNAVLIANFAFNQLYITNKTECLNYASSEVYKRRLAYSITVRIFGLKLKTAL